MNQEELSFLFNLMVVLNETRDQESGLGRNLDRDFMFFEKIKEFIEKSNVTSDHLFFKASEFLAVLGFVARLKRIETLHEQFNAIVAAFNVLNKPLEEVQIRQRLILEISSKIVDEARIAKILDRQELFKFDLPVTVPKMDRILEYIKIHERILENNSFKFFSAKSNPCPNDWYQADLRALKSNEPVPPGHISIDFTSEGFRYIPQVLPKPHDTTNE